MNSELEKLLIEFRNGSETAFERIYHKTKDKITRIISYEIDEKKDVDEILQDVYMVLYNEKNKIQDLSTLMAWLKRIAKNKSADFYRSKKTKKGRINDTRRYKEDIFIDDYENFEELEEEFFHILDSFKEILTDDEYRIITMIELENFSFKEVASIFDTTYKSVYNKYDRGINKMREFVEETKTFQLLISAISTTGSSFEEDFNIDIIKEKLVFEID